MNARRRNIISVVATAVLATILLSVGLFWARRLLSNMRADLLPASAREVTIYPARHVRTDGGGDPNLLAPPMIRARTVPGHPLRAGLGVLHYLRMRIPGISWGLKVAVPAFRWALGSEGEQMYFDPSLGLIVRKGAERIRRDDRTRTFRHFTYYAGPEGVSETPDEELGRFISPVADVFEIQPQVVYDRDLRRFFAISWRADDLVVRKGPELSSDGRYRPVQVGLLMKNFVTIDVPGADMSGPPHPSSQSRSWTIRYLDGVLVLDASGRIDLLDRETLAIRRAAAYLPMPATFFGSKAYIARPEDVAAYAVAPFLRSDNGARGTAVATLSREGLALQLDYFDANGVRIAGGGTTAPRYAETAGEETITERIPSENAAYDHYGGLTAAEFLLESLHPPVLVLLSYFTGPKLEATAGYRSVFLLPDSFVAMIARGSGQATPWQRFLTALAYMLPGLFLFGLLAVRVEREGVRIGVPKNARRGWIAGTLVLGLPAYVTYRLTRPKATLVTCANCGMGRRPDSEKCHRCGSPWVVPELTPPAWRVLDADSPAALGWEIERTQLQDEPSEQR